MLTTAKNLNMGAAGATDRWLLIAGGPEDGTLNMALDEVLLERVIAGGAPALRFYNWNPTTLSLGVNQPFGEIDADECARRGFGVVRRPTGGRAVLHQYELTYSVVARENDERVSGGVVESYRKISAALISGLTRLGADVSLAPPNPGLHRALADTRRTDAGGDWTVSASPGAVCFDVASDYEVTATGRKLVGSAQARRGGALLQHGSVLLDIDWDAWASVFAYRTPAGRERALSKLPSRMISLNEHLGRTVGFEEAASAIAEGFAETLHISLERGTLSQAERAEAERLANGKYRNPAWTMRK